MKLARALHQFTKWFHIFGQSCYSSFDALSPVENLNQNVLTANLMPSVVLLVIIVAAAIATCLLIHHIACNTFLDYLIIILCIFSLTFTVFVAVSQSISLRKQFVELFQQINMIELLTQDRFTMNFPAFRRYYLRQISIIFAACFVELLGTIIIKPKNQNDLATSLTVVSLRFVTLITMFHLLFYVSLFQYIVRAFVRYVEIRAIASTTTPSTTATNVLAYERRGTNARDVIIELNYFKLIHFYLWEICDTMNNVFGWTFTAMLFQLSMYAIYNVYFAFVLLMVPRLENESMRKFESPFNQSHRFWGCL